MYLGADVSHQFRSVQKRIDAFRDMINAPIGSNKNSSKYSDRFIHSRFSEKTHPVPKNIFKFKNYDSIYSDSEYDSDSSYAIGKKRPYNKRQNLLSDDSSYESESSYMHKKRTNNSLKYDQQSYLESSESSYSSISYSCQETPKFKSFRKSKPTQIPKYLSSESSDSEDSIVTCKQFNLNPKKPVNKQLFPGSKRRYISSSESSSSDESDYLVTKKTKIKNFDSDCYSSELSTSNSSLNIDSEYDSESSSFIYQSKRKQLTKPVSKNEKQSMLPKKQKEVLKNDFFLSESSSSIDYDSTFDSSIQSPTPKLATVKKVPNKSKQPPKVSPKQTKVQSPINKPTPRNSISSISFKINENCSINNSTPTKYHVKSDLLSISSIEEIENTYNSPIKDKSVKFVSASVNNSTKIQNTPIQTYSILKNVEKKKPENQFIARFTHFHSTYPNMCSSPSKENTQPSLESSDQLKDSQTSVLKGSFNMQNISDNFTESESEQIENQHGQASPQFNNDSKSNSNGQFIPQNYSEQSRSIEEGQIKPQFEFKPSNVNENSEEIINDDDDDFPIEIKPQGESKSNKQINQINETDSMNFADESRIDDDSQLSSISNANEKVNKNQKSNKLTSNEKPQNDQNDGKSSMDIDLFISKLGSSKASALGELDDESDDEDIQELLRIYGKQDE